MFRDIPKLCSRSALASSKRGWENIKSDIELDLDLMLYYLDQSDAKHFVNLLFEHLKKLKSDDSLFETKTPVSDFSIGHSKLRFTKRNPQKVEKKKKFITESQWKHASNRSIKKGFLNDLNKKEIFCQHSYANRNNNNNEQRRIIDSGSSINQYPVRATFYDIEDTNTKY